MEYFIFFAIAFFAMAAVEQAYINHLNAKMRIAELNSICKKCKETKSDS